MTQNFIYHSAFDSITQFNVALGTDVVRLGSEQGFEEVAEHLASGSTEITFDDPDGNLGTSGDAFRGLMRFFVDETAMASNYRRVFVGIFGSRSYRRRAGSTDSLRLGPAREIRAELQDVNALASLRAIPQDDRGAIRPAETVSARLTWILNSVYLSTVYDDGLVVANTTMMDKSDYRGQRPANVINDCEMTAGFGWNAFIYWHEVNNRAALFFDNANTSTAYTSTLRISNVLADLDTLTAAQFTTGTTFGPSIDAELRRDPADLGTGVYLPYLNGAVYRTSASSVADYGRKDIVAPNSNVSSSSKAKTIADDFLWQHHTEEDRITLTVELPTNKVNLIRAGHRIEVKFQHLPGYEDWTWMRVLKRAPAQSRPTDDRYVVHLELSPQEGQNPDAAPTCGTLDRTPEGSYWPLGDDAAPGPKPSDGVVQYFRPGLPNPVYPILGEVGDWNFWTFGVGGPGTIDYAGGGVSNRLIFCVVGSGTAVVQTELDFDAHPPRELTVIYSTTGNTAESAATYSAPTAISSGESFTVEIVAGADDETCVNWIIVSEGTSGDPTRWGWSQMTWSWDGGSGSGMVTPPVTPPVAPPSGGGGSMLLGLDVGAWGDSIAAEVATCVDVANINISAGTTEVAGYAAEGLTIMALIEGPYNSGGVQALDPVTWAAAASAKCVANPEITVLEVLNEPGGSWFWGSGAKSSANAAAYALLLKTVYDKFVADMGGSRPKIIASWDGGYAGGSDWGSMVLAADPNFLTYIDGVVVHPYGGNSDRTASALGNRGSVAAARSDTGLPVYITEVGWPTAVGQPSTGDSFQWTEAEQATNITNFVTWARAQGYIEAVTIFNYQDYGSNYWYGITSIGGAHKASFAALAAL